MLPEENSLGFTKLFGKTVNADLCDFFDVRPNKLGQPNPRRAVPSGM
jgi:hypothetical protein